MQFGLRRRKAVKRGVLGRSEVVQEDALCALPHHGTQTVTSMSRQTARYLSRETPFAPCGTMAHR